MIQLNLLPDVKLEHIKATKTKRFVVLVSAIVSGAALTVVLLLFLVVGVFQKQHLNNLNKDISRYSQELRDVPELDKILTVQGQLQSLPGLHEKKVVASRLFNYLEQLTPSRASIAVVDIDFVNGRLKITGAANDSTTVNKFVDTLKFTTYSTPDEKTGNAFSSVVLASFSNSATGAGASYQLDLQFDPVIFDSAQEVSLTVPKIITTRSETERPTDLFSPNPKEQ